MKYIVTYATKFGTISAESKKPEDLVDVLDDLKRLESKLQQSNNRSKSKKHSNDASSKRTGTGETTVILGAIESKLLSSNFFSSPKTTGETAERLAKLSGKRFTSRKVSQALGILHDKGTLRRTGERNSYAYSTG